MQVINDNSRKSIFVLSKLVVFLSFIAAIAILAPAATAQYGDPLTEVGFKPFGSFDFTNVDSVNLVNFQLNLHIPLPSYPQRGRFSTIGYYVGYNANASVPEYVTYPCTFFGADCGTNCTDFYPVCNVTLQLEQSVIGGVYLGAPGGSDDFSGGSGGVITEGGAIHETVIVPSLGGVMTVDTSGFYDTNPLGGNGLPDTLKSSDGVSLINYPGPSYYTDPAENMLTSTADTIGRTLPDVSRLPVGPYPDLGTSSGQGWTQTTDFSNCTGPLQTVAAIEVSFPSMNNSTAQYKICYAQFYVSENYSRYYDYSDDGALPVGSWSINPTYDYLSAEQIQSIILPNLSAYTFSYDGYTTLEAATEAGALGDLLQITLPTGGTISYTWGNPPYPPEQISCAHGVEGGVYRALKSRTVNANDGTGPHTWSYSMAPGPGAPYSAGDSPYLSIVTDPLNNDTVHTFTDVDTADDSCMYYETGTQYYQGKYTSGTVLKTATTQYSYTSWQQYSQATGDIGLRHPIDIVPSTITTAYPDGSGMMRTLKYDAGFQLADDDGTPVAGAYGILGNVMSETDVDLSTGKTLRTITNTYKTDSSYISAWIVRLLSSSVVTDGSGNTDSDTLYGYDESPSPQGVYGNQTSVKEVVDGSGAKLIWGIAYNSQGMPFTATDPRSNATITTYDTTGLFPSKVQQPTTNGVCHIDYYSYDANTGQLLYHTDQNGSSADDTAHTTTYTYNDPLNRITQINYPLGVVGFSYDDSTLTVQKMTTATPDPTIITSQVFDGLGRPSVTTGANGATSETTYDALSRVVSATNPHLTSSSKTDGTTTYTYDPLNRKLRETHPDSTYLQWSYIGSTTTAADEAGNSTQLSTDGLGRLTKVVDPGQFVTNYTYDGMGNLLTVNQLGNGTTDTARVRGFVYDMLSRLTSASNPETGAVSYTYSIPGSICAGDASAPCSKTDARGVGTTYNYDLLNRLLSKTYSDGFTASSCYQYDTAPVNGIGRLAAEWTQKATCPGSGSPPPSGVLTGKTILSYDAMGRSVMENQCAWSNCTTGSVPYSKTYSYDLTGNLTLYLNGINSLAFSQTYDSAGQLKSITSGTTPIFSMPSYSPAGALTGATYGAGLNLTRTYDNRLRITGESDAGTTGATKGSATVIIAGSEQSQ
jgi:YD repeat-containing protein